MSPASMSPASMSPASMSPAGMSPAGMSATEKILAFARAEHHLPAETKAIAEHLLSDTLAVGAAGAASDEAQNMLAAVQGWGGGDEARLLGLPERLPTPSAAWFNGFAIHCLEWDAVHEPAVVHAMSVVTGALLAAADRIGRNRSDRRNRSDGAFGSDDKDSDRDRFLTALCVGVDVAAGLGIAATGPMQFFRPATAGVIGAALAVARLELLAADKLADVVGLAYSQAAGTMQAHREASLALPLQIANAARAAITAVDLVKVGMNGPRNALEGPFGYFRLFEPGEITRYSQLIGSQWLIEDVSIKPFPSGRASHGVLGALDTMLRDGALAGSLSGGLTGSLGSGLTGSLGSGQIERITVEAPPLIYRLVGRPSRSDMTPSYARLCLPFLIALMLRDQSIDPRCFTPAQFADPLLRKLADKVTVTIDDNPDHNALAPQKLEIHLAGGRLAQKTISDNPGSPSAPMSNAQTRAKRRLAAALTKTDCAAQIFDDPLGYATEPR